MFKWDSSYSDRPNESRKQNNKLSKETKIKYMNEKKEIMNGNSTISFLNTKDGSDRRLQIFIFLSFRQEKGREVGGLVGAWMLVESLFETFLVRLGVRNGFLFIDWKSDGPTKKKGLESRCHESDNSFVKLFLTVDCLVLTFSATHT